MPYRTILNIAKGAVNTVSEFYEDVTETVRSITPEPINQALDVFVEKFEEGFAKTPIGVAERGAAATGELIAEKTGNQALGQAVGFGLGLAVPGPDISRAATPVIPKGVKPPKPQPEPTNLTMPPGMVPALAGGNGGLRLNFSKPRVDIPETPQVMPLTVSDPELLAPGIVPGVGKSQTFTKGIARLRKMERDQAIKLKEYNRQLNDGEITQKQYKERMAKMKKFEDANYSTLGTPDDPDIFEVKSEVQRDPTNPALPAHQHHAAAKSMTAPWVKRALKLGDDDDVAAFFEFHRLLTGSGMGNARSGIIDMPGFAHIARDARNEAEKALAVHSFMQKQGAGIQILSSEVEKMIGNPKNMEELMRSYMTFAEEYLIPQKELSLKRLKGALSEHRKTLPKSELPMFDNLVDKLNKANT